MVELKKSGEGNTEKLEDYGLSEYLKIKQKYFDSYQESLAQQETEDGQTGGN